MPLSFTFGNADTEVSYGASSHQDPTVVNPVCVQDKHFLHGFHLPSKQDREQQKKAGAVRGSDVTELIWRKNPHLLAVQILQCCLC